MPETTPRLLLPYPTPDETADVPRDFQALADRVEALTGWIRTADVQDGAITTAKLAEALQTLVASAGDLKATARATAPTGWLLCDGAAVSRATYSALFTAIGTAFNVGGEAGTDFRLPDLRGRVPVGVDADGVRIATATGRDRGESGGAEKHALTADELAAHSHSDGSLATDVQGIHQHPAQSGFLFAMTGRALGVYLGGGGGQLETLTTGPSAGTVYSSPAATEYAGNHSHGVNGSTGSAGSGAAHPTMPPYQVVNWLIKT